MGSRVLHRSGKAQNDWAKVAFLKGHLDELLTLSRRIGSWIPNPGQEPIAIGGREVLLIQESICILICEGLEERLRASPSSKCKGSLRIANPS